MIRILRRTAILRAEHAAPPFQLFKEAWRLQQPLYEVLARCGVGPGELRIEQVGSESSLTCNVLSLGMVVNLRLSHLEIFVMEPNDADAMRHDVIRQLLGVVGQLVGGFRMYSLSLDHHGALEEASAMEIIGRYVQPPQDGLSALTGASAAFYYGPVGDRVLTSVHLEPSSLVPGGLFVKTSFVWRAAESLTYERLAEDARDSIAQVFQTLGLQPAPVSA